MNNSLRKSREVSDNAKGYLLVSGCIVDVWQSMRLLTAGSLVRAQLEEPVKTLKTLRFRGFLRLEK